MHTLYLQFQFANLSGTKIKVFRTHTERKELTHLNNDKLENQESSEVNSY